MTERLSEGELARIEELATAAHDYGGDEQELGELALALVAEVRAAREREASGVPTDEMVEAGARALLARPCPREDGETDDY